MFTSSTRSVDHPSLLITDDDRGFRETLGGVFERWGFRTRLAADGEEALQIVQSEEIHLVLMDMHMPKLTGLETWYRVRQIRAGMPCILISAGLDDDIRAEAHAAHVFSVLSKPVRYSDVTETVCEALKQTYNWRSDR